MMGIAGRHFSPSTTMTNGSASAVMPIIIGNVTSEIAAQARRKPRPMAASSSRILEKVGNRTCWIVVVIDRTGYMSTRWPML